MFFYFFDSRFLPYRADPHGLGEIWAAAILRAPIILPHQFVTTCLLAPRKEALTVLVSRLLLIRASAFLSAAREVKWRPKHTRLHDGPHHQGGNSSLLLQFKYMLQTRRAPIHDASRAYLCFYVYLVVIT